MTTPYERFLESKAVSAPERGFIGNLNLNPDLKPHARDIAAWMIRGGNRACFASFGLHKTSIQLQICESLLEAHPDGAALIVCPLGVRREFMKEQKLRGFQTVPVYIRTNAEYEQFRADGHRLFLTNYERIRDGDLDPNLFTICTLDEAAVLRSFGSKTYQTFLPKFDCVPFKYVATATPSPNRYKELIHYAGFLGIMDTGQALTRFFKRDSSQAGNLTIHPHKEREFWLWVSTWATFITKPSDLGYSDEGYDLPPLDIIRHRLPVDYATAGFDSWGQGKLIRNAATSLSDAAREKRDSLAARVQKCKEICEAHPDDNIVIWCELEAERRAIQKAIPGVESIWGSQDIDDREEIVERFADGQLKRFSTKFSLSGSGSNFQEHCHVNICLGLSYKFADFIQGVHRTQRFGQKFIVQLHLIYTESEDPVHDTLMQKWKDHDKLHETMRHIIQEFGLNQAKVSAEMRRSIGITRQESKGDLYTTVNNDNVAEMSHLADNSVDLIVTSWPFSDHYEYTECYDEQTQVLTQRGWKTFGEISSEDMLGTLNPDNRQMEWQAPSEIIWQPYAGPMVHFYTRNSFDLMVTPNHKMFVTERIGNQKADQTQRFALVRADSMVNRFAHRKWRIAAAAVPGGGFQAETVIIPRTRKRTMPNTWTSRKITARDFMELAGWYLSEGCCTLTTGTISISQSAEVNPNYHHQIGQLFERIGIAAKAGPRGIVAHNVDLANWLVRQFGAGSYSKHIPRWVKSLHPDLLSILRATMMKGDGNKTGFAYTSYSTQLRDDFQEICFLTGWRTSICGNVVRIGQKDALPELRDKPTICDYNGMIGCATVPNHTLVVRRNGTAAVSGNSYNDFGHNDGDRGFFEQMEFLTPELIRVLGPGRMYCVHAKDRIVYGSVSGDGMYTVNPFSDKCVAHCLKHGLRYCGRITVATDVVRENNQTYRLGYSENAKDGTKMGVGSPEYVLLFRKLPTDHAKAYADRPVPKPKEDYTRARWQLDAHSFWRSNGNRFLTPDEIGTMPMDDLRMLWHQFSKAKVYDYGEHVRISEEMEKRGILPASFMALDPPNPGSHWVWDDVARMRTLNTNQGRKGWEQHVCPLQLDIVERLIERFCAKGEIILDPFGGLGTVAYCAVGMGRRGYSIELNEQYWRDSKSYCHAAECKVTMPTLFDMEPTGDADAITDR